MKTYILQVDDSEKMEVSGPSEMSIALRFASFNNSTIDTVIQNKEYLATQRYTGNKCVIKIEVK